MQDGVVQEYNTSRCFLAPYLRTREAESEADILLDISAAIS